MKLFENGFCSVQDESAVIVTELLAVKEKETILDLCAAPGGKLTGILEQHINTAKLVGIDSDLSRLKVVKENITRLRLPEVSLICADAAKLCLRHKFDKILIDAPCSGFGALQKKPEIKWRRSLQDILQFQQLQTAILVSAASLLKPDGKIVYSTCTIDPAENEQVIQNFLNQCTDFRIGNPPGRFRSLTENTGFLKTYPHIHGMDGSFAACLTKGRD